MIFCFLQIILCKRFRKRCKGINTDQTTQQRFDPKRNIINFSKHSFTNGQYDLLNKNLNFCPTTGHYNKGILKKDLESFNRKIKLKAFFCNKNVQKQETELANKEPIIKSKTNWEPKKNRDMVETLIEAVNKDIVERFSDTKKLPKNNLTDSDKNAIEYFSKCKNLVITKADKGRATVILDVKHYIAKANEQLQDNPFYQKLNVDPTAKHSDIINSAIESFRKQELLSNSPASKLTVNEVRTPQFHVFPKFHKTNMPGRPVLSSVECHTSKISKFAYHYLEPHPNSLPSYVKDTSDFINKINETKDINKHTILVTLDVKSLYTNILNHEGIEAVKRALNCISKADCYESYYQVLVLNTNTQQFCIQ